MYLSLSVLIITKADWVNNVQTSGTGCAAAVARRTVSDDVVRLVGPKVTLKR